MASIYDKALKRKDFSGIVDKDAKDSKMKPSIVSFASLNLSFSLTPVRVKVDADPKADDPKAGADVGKIVNLMAGDANRISQTISGSYFIYGGKNFSQDFVSCSHVELDSTV